MTLTTTHETEEATMLLAYATGGATDTALAVKAYTWEGFCARLMSPRVGNKDGSYYIRGGKLRANKRSDENLLEGELLILDADSTFDPVSGEITSGAPPLRDVASALERLGYTFVAHTSHSARPQDDFWKYRVVFPARLRSAEELGDCLDYLLAQLHGEGVYIADVAEARRWSQPWFLPRVRSEEDRAHFVAIQNNALPFDVSAALDWAESRRKAESQIHSARTRQADPVSTGNALEADRFRSFNDAASLDWVRDTLEGAGYRFGYFDRRQQCYRYMRPGSESRTHGVVVFRGSQGHWCVYSHHGTADPLSQRVSDPFDLATILRFSGDRKAAARALLPQRPPEPSIVERIAARQMEGEARPINSVSLQADPAINQTEPFIVQNESATASEQSKPGKKRVQIIPLTSLQDVPVRWLVRDLLPAASFSAIYGRPGSYKSFVALHIATCVAAGLECFGKPVEAGPVIYVAGEGGAGLKRRMDALRKHWSLGDDLPIYFVKSQLNMRTSLDDYDALCAAIDELAVKPKLIIFDTFARIFAGGEENSAKDVGETIVILGAIQERYETAVAIIHHAGKDESRGMRGSSALLGAVDAELECVKVSPEDGTERTGKLTVTKQKDGEDGVIFGYRMETVALSDIDPDVTSLAVEPLDPDEMKKAGIGPKDARPKGARLSKSAKKALAVLKNLLADSEIRETGVVPDLSRSVPCLKKDTWRETYVRESALDRRSAMRSFSRANESLWTNETVSGFGDYVWISKDYESDGK